MGIVSPSERSLCRKLLATYHLSVQERQALPRGQARFSVFVAVVEAMLRETGWFPAPLPAGGDIGSGARIELREGEVWLHEQWEIGVNRFSQHSCATELPTSLRQFGSTSKPMRTLGTTPSTVCRSIGTHSWWMGGPNLSLLSWCLRVATLFT